MAAHRERGQTTFSSQLLNEWVVLFYDNRCLRTSVLGLQNLLLNRPPFIPSPLSRNLQTPEGLSHLG